jgi:hypothetical protein
MDFPSDMRDVILGMRGLWLDCDRRTEDHALYDLLQHNTHIRPPILSGLGHRTPQLTPVGLAGRTAACHNLAQ